MKQLLLILLLFLIPLRIRASQLPEILARFGNIELKKERFQLFALPSSPTERKAALKKLIDTEVYLIIVRQLLERSGIAPDAGTAKKYIEMRKKKFNSTAGKALVATLEKNVIRPEFQLKCALYFTFYAVDPALVEPTSEDVRSHFFLNKEQFQIPVNSELALFRGGDNTPEGKKQTDLILARLRQGEDFYTLAKQYDPEGRGEKKPPEPELRPYFKKVRELPVGSWDKVETPAGIFIVKVLSRSPRSYRSFEETEFYITETLSNARLKNTLEQYMREILVKTPVRYFF